MTFTAGEYGRLKEFRDSPAFQDLYNRMRANILSKWADTDTTDVEGREALYKLQKGADLFIEALSSAIGDAALAAQRQLEGELNE